MGQNGIIREVPMKNRIDSTVARKTYLQSLSKKRMSAGGLIFDTGNRLLLVKPSYKKEWLIPGGVIEKHESPRSAADREVMEEIGIPLCAKALLCVDYKIVESEDDEALSFIFDYGIIDQERVTGIRIDGEEIIDFAFKPASELSDYLAKTLCRRVTRALVARRDYTTLYLENGQVVWGPES